MNPIGTAGISLIDARDVGAVAAQRAHPPRLGRADPRADRAPRPVTYAEIARARRRHAPARPPTVVDVTLDQVRASLDRSRHGRVGGRPLRARCTSCSAPASRSSSPTPSHGSPARAPRTIEAFLDEVVAPPAVPRMSACLPCDLESADAASRSCSATTPGRATWPKATTFPAGTSCACAGTPRAGPSSPPTRPPASAACRSGSPAAIREATGAPTVYFMSFGENYPHFHFLVIARPADLAPEHRGAGILALREANRDPVASLAVAADVRAALLRQPASRLNPFPHTPNPKGRRCPLRSPTPPPTAAPTPAAATASSRTAGTPLVIALHGGTYTSEYFDIPGYSLLDRGRSGRRARHRARPAELRRIEPARERRLDHPRQRRGAEHRDRRDLGAARRRGIRRRPRRALDRRRRRDRDRRIAAVVAAAGPRDLGLTSCAFPRSRRAPGRRSRRSR